MAGLPDIPGLLEQGKAKETIALLQNFEPKNERENHLKVQWMLVANYQLGNWKEVLGYNKQLVWTDEKEAYKNRILKMVRIAEKKLQIQSPTVQKKYGLAGCGLGSMLRDPESSQTLAMSLNITGSQSSAILLGTSNCSIEEQNKQAKQAFWKLHQDKIVLERIQKAQPYTEAYLQLAGCSKETTSSLTNITSAWRSGVPIQLALDESIANCKGDLQ